MPFTDIDKLIVFGAKSIALGACLAIRELYPKCRVEGFMVSSLNDNPDHLCGLPVMEIDCCGNKDIHILIAIPEDVQASVASILIEKGFTNILCLDSAMERPDRGCGGRRGQRRRYGNGGLSL